LLKAPIIVKASDAFFRFDEIVIIEPGDPGSTFGDVEFWDYVILEGTSDGVNWLPLCDGYDSRTDPAWLDVYNTSGSVDESLYRGRSIDMLQTFSPGDTILIRFRLFADEYFTGWGWAIDNLEIQQNLTDVKEAGPSIPRKFHLSQNYPNPFNAATTILFAVPKTSNVTLKVYDMTGREVKTLLDRECSPGNYEVVWNANELASGTYFYKIEADHFQESKKFILLK
jgi:hypothetical protein